MKKLLLLFATIICLTVPTRSWDIESYFGIKIGMPKSECLKKMDAFVKKIQPNNYFAKTNHASDLDTNQYYYFCKNHDKDSYKYQFSLTNNDSLCVFPSFNNAIQYVTNIATIEFKRQILNSIILSCNYYVPDNGNLLSLDELVPSFADKGFKENYTDFGSDENGNNFNVIAWKNTKSKNFISLYVYEPNNITFDSLEFKFIKRSRSYYLIYRKQI